MLKRYIKIWWILTLATTQLSFQSRFGAILFLLGKLLRFFFFIFFIFVLVDKTKEIAGYSLWQVIFFLATFNFLDSLPQFFFRNVYRFRNQIVTGYFDNLLTKPLPALFHPLFGGSDLLDIVIIISSVFFIIFSGMQLEITGFGPIFLYIVLLCNGLLIATAFHIFVLASGILSTTVDNAVMVYRDLTQMGRFPVEIYQEPLRGIITFVIPIGIMMTFPGKAFMGLLSIQLVLVSIVVGCSLFFVSLRFWRYALGKYSSASS